MSSPSRTITATDASSSSARAVVTGTGPTRSISQRSPCLVWPRASAGTVDGARDLDRLAWTLARQRDERVGGVGGVRLARPARRASRKIRSMWAFHAELNRAPASGAMRASMR